MTDDLRAQRLAVLEEHFRSEIDHDWDACLATFADVPRYEKWSGCGPTRVSLCISLSVSTSSSASSKRAVA